MVSGFIRELFKNLLIGFYCSVPYNKLHPIKTFIVLEKKIENANTFSCLPNQIRVMPIAYKQVLKMIARQKKLE
jgi:hypothetical protein